MTLPLPLAEGTPTAALAVRTLTIADAEAAAEVIRAAFAAQSRTTRPPSSALGETAATIADKIEAGGGFGALAGAALVAVALWRIDGEAMLIARVATLPAWRGRGLAQALVAQCEARARSAGVERMTLRVRLELPENERFFASLGFTRAGIDAHAGFDHPTIAVMEKAP